MTDLRKKLQNLSVGEELAPDLNVFEQLFREQAPLLQTRSTSNALFNTPGTKAFKAKACMSSENLVPSSSFTQSVDKPQMTPCENAQQ